jgi:hypothetical protein
MLPSRQQQISNKHRRLARPEESERVHGTNRTASWQAKPWTAYSLTSNKSHVTTNETSSDYGITGIVLHTARTKLQLAVMKLR